MFLSRTNKIKQYLDIKSVIIFLLIFSIFCIGMVNGATPLVPEGGPGYTVTGSIAGGDIQYTINTNGEYEITHDIITTAQHGVYSTINNIQLSSTGNNIYTIQSTNHSIYMIGSVYATSPISASCSFQQMKLYNPYISYECTVQNGVAWYQATQTVNLDQLMVEGELYVQSYAQSPRYGTLTGYLTINNCTLNGNNILRAYSTLAQGGQANSQLEISNSYINTIDEQSYAISTFKLNAVVIDNFHRMERTPTIEMIKCNINNIGVVTSFTCIDSSLTNITYLSPDITNIGTQTIQLTNSSIINSNINTNGILTVNMNTNSKISNSTIDLTNMKVSTADMVTNNIISDSYLSSTTRSTSADSSYFTNMIVNNTYLKLRIASSKMNLNNISGYITYNAVLSSVYINNSHNLQINTFQNQNVNINNSVIDVYNSFATKGANSIINNTILNIKDTNQFTIGDTTANKNILNSNNFTINGKTSAGSASFINISDSSLVDTQWSDYNFSTFQITDSYISNTNNHNLITVNGYINNVFCVTNNTIENQNNLITIPISFGSSVVTTITNNTWLLPNGNGFSQTNLVDESLSNKIITSGNPFALADNVIDTNPVYLKIQDVDYNC